MGIFSPQLLRAPISLDVRRDGDVITFGTEQSDLVYTFEVPPNPSVGASPARAVEPQMGSSTPTHGPFGTVTLCVDGPFMS